MRAEIVALQEQLATQAAAREADAVVARQAAHRLNLFEAMMETVPIGVVLADAKGRIVHGNSHVEEMVRHPVLHSEDVDSYGEWVSFHADGHRVESREYPLSRVIRDGEERSEIDVHYQRGDGTRFWMRIIGEPVRNGDGDLIGATVALIDIDKERQLQDQQKILIAELNHRVKNAFTVVKSIVGQSLRGEHVPEGLRATLDDRLDAYSRAHAKLIGTAWDRAPLGRVAADIVRRIAGDRVRIEGPEIEVPSRQALAFSMAFYELATNALKYGSLSVPEGTVDLAWCLDGPEDAQTIAITWTEHGGPAPVEPSRKGFGSFIVGRALAMETGGQVKTTYPAEGFAWRLDMPAPVETKEETT
ncbi:HWE histidine kinase domain-containing protein [Aestuariibius sp. 2305UL40-4]|uniref:HWE histidine kinase domain-containing protein n=1 Tax=Aestuariibius violaceus TaxID=3234132 RepID=UPI00345EE9D6